MSKKCVLILTLLLCMMVQPTFAQDSAGMFEPDSPRYDQLVTIEYALRTLDDLQARGVLTEDDAKSQRRYYLSQADDHNGDSLSRAELERELDSGEGFQWSRALNFVNIIWVFAGLIIALSVILIFSMYIWPLLRMVPIIVYEVLAYLAAFGIIIFAGEITGAATAQFAALPGNLLLAGLMLFSYGYHIKRPRRPQNQPDEDDRKAAKPNKRRSNPPPERIWVLYFGILTLVWGASAIAYGSQLIGVMTVLAVLGMLFASGIIRMIVEIFSFRQNELVPMAIMLISLATLIGYITAEASDLEGVYPIFETGIYLVGVYGYFISLEILSLQWFRRKAGGGFWRWQGYSLVAGLVGMGVGVFFAIHDLTEASTTFLLIFLLTKYIELIDWKKNSVWGLLGLGILLYLAALFINRYPELFLLN